MFKKKIQDQNKYLLPYIFGTFLVFLLVPVYTILDWVFDCPTNILAYVGGSICIILIIWVIITLIVLCRNIDRRNWYHVCFIVVVPIIVATFFGLFFDKNRIRLEYNKSNYMKEITETQVSDISSRLKSWNWGASGGFAVSPVCYYTLVYDESNQISLKTAHNSDHKSIIVKHIDGNFYLVEDWTW